MTNYITVSFQPDSTEDFILKVHPDFVTVNMREVGNGGVTVFLTTHDMVTADELCDRVAFMVDGRMAALDAPRTLRLAHGRRIVRVEVDRGGVRESREFALDGLDRDDAFLALLRDGVQTIHTLETTLEDVFVRVTGRTLA